MSLQSSGIYRKLTENVSVLVQVLEIHICKINQKAATLQSKECCENWKQQIELLKAAHSKVLFFHCKIFVLARSSQSTHLKLLLLN